jgi:hypothetical protein
VGLTVAGYTILMMRVIPNHPFDAGGIHKRARTHLPAGSERREMMGLLGSLIIFLMGLPGHSETWVQSTSTVVRHLVQLVLVFLGLVTPTVQTPVVPAHLTPVAKVMKRAAPQSDSMIFRTEPILHRYNYIFEGKATFHHQPAANASVLVRLQSGERTAAKGTVTNAVGSYRIEVPIDAMDQAPVDWEMEAYTADFIKVELSGRRIVQKEEEETNDPITVTTPVEFKVSLSK